MRKGCKSPFVAAVKENVADHFLEKEETPSGKHVVYIIDAMAFIQKKSAFGMYDIS